MIELNFQPFPLLETERFVLRRMTLADGPEMLFLRSDDAVLEFINREKATSLKQAEDFIQLIDKLIDGNESILWAIAWKDNPEKLIGTICIWQIQKEDFRAAVGYVLHPSQWRKGIMKEVLLKVVDYGFSTLQLHSIAAEVAPKNIASCTLLESVGFVREAYFKENVCYKGEFFDTAIYSLLKKSFYS